MQNIERVLGAMLSQTGGHGVAKAAKSDVVLSGGAIRARDRGNLRLARGSAAEPGEAKQGIEARDHPADGRRIAAKMSGAGELFGGFLLCRDGNGEVDDEVVAVVIGVHHGAAERMEANHVLLTANGMDRDDGGGHYGRLAYEQDPLAGHGAIQRFGSSGSPGVHGARAGLGGR